MSGLEVLPRRARFAPGEPIVIERRGDPRPGEASVWTLGEPAARRPWTDDADLVLDPLPPGGHGVELLVDGVIARTAVEVAGPGRDRQRYGFVADYAPGRDPAGLADTVRRLHLTDVQFYDWAYRHADLLGGGERYLDALGQPISLGTVRALVDAVAAAGARALGYAAVYGVGREEWPRWRHRALLTSEGAPYGLGDFLSLVDPAADDWLASFASQLAQAAESVGFAGFHLDQYGYPKRAARADGVVVDLADSFVRLIRHVRASLPQRLVFNNVNDFPTWATAGAPQDAVYVEVWPPHVDLGALAAVVTRARSVAAGKPVVIAAYQHVYEEHPVEAADLATRFTMATLFSHGATQLLAGEEDRILTDPYYVRNHAAAPSTTTMLRTWYDFLVEHDELLVAEGLVDVTGAYAGEYNGDVEIAFGDASVTGVPEAGAVWRRIVQAGDRLVVHVVNLLGQADTLWDAPRRPVAPTGPGTLTLRRIGREAPRVRVADPDGSPRLRDVEVRLEGDVAVALLPSATVWQLVVVDLPAAEDRA